ncbi:MAG: threonine-phosphate decarboxylase, partial [Pseudomonadota bacterium]
IGGTDLFRLIETPHATIIHQGLAREGVWTRRFLAMPRLLRVGLPGQHVDRFAATLHKVAERL